MCHCYEEEFLELEEAIGEPQLQPVTASRKAKRIEQEPILVTA